RKIATIIFIAMSLAIYMVMGSAPAALLVFAGGFNGLIFPIGMTLFIFVAWRRQDLMNCYKYPMWLQWSAILVCALT
ncbi:hypothetical protein O9379_18740, partial [Proteus mirabilis]|nr:hypothetical protein [Proteus mirabilis]